MMRKREILQKAGRPLLMLNAHKRRLTTMEGGLLEKLYHVEYLVWLLKQGEPLDKAFSILQDVRGIKKDEMLKLLDVLHFGGV